MYKIYTKIWCKPPGYAVKFIRIMKVLLLLMTACLIQVSAASYGQKITLNEKNASLISVIEKINKQSGIEFITTDELLANAKVVNITVKNLELNVVLKRIFEGQNLSYTIEHNKTVVIKAKAPSFLDRVVAALVVIDVAGRVLDEQGKPLVGASVVVKERKLAVSTSANGEFVLRNIEETDVLVVSYIGYTPKEIKVADLKRNPAIVLSEITNELNETVVVGYGTQKKTDITGAIATIGEKDLGKRTLGNASFDRALGGMAKGVFVTETSGEPGSAASINIRGFTSPFSGGNNEPLFVIDGIILNTDAQFNTGGETISAIQNNPLLAMDPVNIENISILKDAAATAIYGSRGANGVIIVTTKKGRKGEKPIVSLSYTNSYASPIGRLKPMNTAQFKDFTDLLLQNTVAAINSGQLPVSRLTNYAGTGLANLSLNPTTQKYTYGGLIPGFFGNADIDWFKQIYRSNANTQQANLSIRGGSNNTTYSLGGSYYDQQGLMLNSSLKQYSFNLNLHTALSKYISTGASLNLNANTSKGGNNPDIGIRGQFYLTARPDMPIYDEKGVFMRQPVLFQGQGYSNANPVAQLQHESTSKGYNLAGNAFIAAEPITGLKLKAAFNTGMFLTRTDQFSPQVTYNIVPNSPLAESTLSVSDALMTNYITDISADYNLKLNELQQLNFTAGYIWDRTMVKRTYNYYQGFPDDEILNNVNNARTAVAYGGGSVETGLNSIFGRLNYNFGDRYLATVNFRSDASSKFGPSNKRGYFPSLSLGWNISNESFFDNKGLMERLKLRLSAGKTGSSNISDFAYFQFFQKGFRDLGLYNGQPAVEFSGTLSNPEISWETTYDYNAGLDFDLKGRRIYGTIDVYYRNTPNSLAATPFPVELGLTSYTSNLLNMSNKGIEIEVNADILRQPKGFSWTVGLNWSLNRNRIKSLNGGNVSNDTFINSFFADNYIEGQPAGTIKGYKTAGIFQSQAEIDALNTAAVAKYGAGSYYDLKATSPGDVKMVDVNGDGKITVADRVVLGSIQPDFFGGINNTFSYKGFELTAFFQFVKGSESTWSNASSGAIPLDNNLAIFADNTWTTQNTGARYPRAVLGNPGQNSRASDRTVFDNSYLRLKTLYLSYAFGQKVTNRLKMSSLSVYISAANLFTITNWRGTDPGSLSDGSIIGRTQNAEPYPLAKTISLGLNVQF